MSKRCGCSLAFFVFPVFAALVFSGASAAASAHAAALSAAEKRLATQNSFELGNDIADLFCPNRPPLQKFLNRALNEADFSLEKMYVYAVLAKQAYAAASAEKNLLKQGFDEIYQIQNKETSFSAFVARKGDHAVLAISGTFGLRDALQDLKFAIVPDSRHLIPGLLHKGFEEAIESVWPLTLKVLSQKSFAGATLHVTGHSLGAATGILAAARLAAAGYHVADVYAFASPRVGNQTFATWYDNLLGDRTYRFIRGVDVVPRVPPDSADSREFASLFPAKSFEEVQRLFENYGYKHVGKLFEFERDADTSAPEWPVGTDMGYWLWLSQQISPGNPFLSLVSSRDAALHHIPDAFVCYPARQLSAEQTN